MMEGLFHTLDDPQIAIGAFAEDLERGLIAFAVVGSGGLCDAVEFDDHDPLDEPGFVSALAAVPRARNRPPAACIAGPASLA
jgi:hypothetical protein